jgi:hypothetical protein
LSRSVSAKTAVAPAAIVVAAGAPSGAVNVAATGRAGVTVVAVMINIMAKH